MRTCSTCHQPFHPKVGSQRFCSSPCRDRKLGRKPRVKHGTTASRGYSSAHQRLRAKLLPQAYYTPCSRCHQLMLPGQSLHLDHDDNDRGQYRGFSHAACNTAAGARKGNQSRNVQQRYTSSAPRITK